MADRAYLAIDMGASSGRHVLGRFDGRKLRLEEVYRFENGPVEVAGHLHWNLLGLWSHVCRGLRAAAAAPAPTAVTSVGVDTWGVDFGLLGAGDELLGNPYHYRDRRTNGMMEKAFALVGREEIFRHTGLQFMQFNTLYQLLAMKLGGSPLLPIAKTFLMMPDLFHWLMTGVKCNELSNASTSQFYDPLRGGWATDLLARFDLPGGILGRIAQPGTNLGWLLPSVSAETGLSASVVLPGTHDTASAVMAVPAQSRPGQRPDWCYISLGTWALMGVESPTPLVNDQVLQRNFTNEAGVGNTTRLLKNIGGLWLVQECRRTWNQQGRTWDWEDLNRLAAAASPLGSLIDPDAAEFLAPENMPETIRAFCRRTSQAVPGDEGGGVALRPGEHRPEVPPRAGNVRIARRRADRDHPYRGRGHPQSPTLPGRGRCLRPPRRGRAGGGHRHRQPHGAGHRRRRRRLDRPSPRNHPPEFRRGRVPAAEHGGLGRRLWAVREPAGIRSPPKGTVPFSSDENWDSPRLFQAAYFGGWMPKSAMLSRLASG